MRREPGAAVKSPEAVDRPRETNARPHAAVAPESGRPVRVTLDMVAKAIDGIVIGDGSIEITGVAGIREARDGELTFLANPRYESYLERTCASAIIVAGNHRELGKPVIENPNPYLAFLKAVHFFQGDEERPSPGIHPTAVVAEDAHVDATAIVGPNAVVESGARIGPRAWIGPGCFVGARASVGAESRFHPNITLREDCVVGERVIIHAGTVIGSDGFGFVRDGEIYRKLPQVGNVVIEDDVELGSCVTIDRATTGDHVVLAGQVGIVGHIEIGAGAQVGAKSGVSKSVKPGEKLFGYPALPVGQAKRIEASLRHLPELVQTIRALKRRVEELEGKKPSP